jgi:hypothetical protein
VVMFIMQNSSEVFLFFSFLIYYLYVQCGLSSNRTTIRL